MTTPATDLVSFALALPEAAQGVHGHRPAFRVGRHLFLVLQPGEDEALVWVDADERHALLMQAPDAFAEIHDKRGRVVESWLTVRLQHADPDVVHEVVEDAWRSHAPKRAIASRDRER